MDKAGEYRQEHYWWDEDDNQYLIEAIWQYRPPCSETGYGEDSELLSLECLDGVEIDHLLVKGGNIWRVIEKEFDITEAVYIDIDDYPDYYNDEVF